MFPFLGISAILRASCREEDLAFSKQVGALPFTSIESKCHREGRVAPVGQLASQHIDPSRDLQHLHSWEHTEPSETSAPSTHLDPELFWTCGGCCCDVGPLSFFLPISVHVSRKVGSCFQHTWPALQDKPSHACAPPPRSPACLPHTSFLQAILGEKMKCKGQSACSLRQGTGRGRTKRRTRFGPRWLWGMHPIPARSLHTGR